MSSWRAGNRQGLSLSLACAWLFLPTQALAHGAVPGMKGFLSGLIHPLMTPAHVLLLLATGLLAGQLASRRLGPLMLLFMPFSALALAFTARFAMPTWMQLVVLLLALVYALLVAVSVRLTNTAVAALFAIAAAALGLDSGVADGATVKSVLVTLAGTWIGLNLFAINLAYYTAILPRKVWLLTGIRVAGSWIAAICFMVIAFASRDMHLF